MLTREVVSAGDEQTGTVGAQIRQMPYLQLTQSKAPQSPLGAPVESAGAPAIPDLLDPVALRTMPPQVAAFMLYEPPEPSTWRAETAGQREERESFEELGGWCG